MPCARIRRTEPDENKRRADHCQLRLKSHLLAEADGEHTYLHLDKLDCCVAIIKNARSNKMGKKDIKKIECPIDFMDLDIFGFIDHNITVNIYSGRSDFLHLSEQRHRRQR